MAAGNSGRSWGGLIHFDRITRSNTINKLGEEIGSSLREEFLKLFHIFMLISGTSNLAKLDRGVLISGQFLERFAVTDRLMRYKIKRIPQFCA